LRAIFDNSGASDASTVFRKLEGGDARRANSILNGDEAAVVPVKAVGTGERAVWTGIYVDARKSFEVDAEHAE